MTLWLLVVIQEAREHFLPQTLNDVLQALGTILAAALFAGGVVWAVIKNHVDAKVTNECKDRKTADTNIDIQVKDHAEKVHNLLGRAQVMENFAQRSEMDRTSIHNQVGKLEGEVDQLAKMFHDTEMARIKELAELKVQMAQGFARLEGALGIDGGGRVHKRENDR